jgi:phosphate-selective porin OprO/OprP
MLGRLSGLLVIVGIFAAGSANAQSSAPDLDKVDRLQHQVEQLQEQLREQIKQVKKDLAEAKKKAAEATAAPSPFDGAYAADIPNGVAKTPIAPPSAIVTMSPNNAPSICTPDQLNCIGLTGTLHLDVGGYNYRPATGRGIASAGVPVAPSTIPQQLDDGINVRRARIGVLGKFMGDWNYNLTYDFGNSSDGFGGLAPGSLPGGGTSGIEQAYLSYTGLSKWTGLTGFAIEGGYMVVPYSSTSPPAPTIPCSWSAHRPRSLRPTSRPATSVPRAASAATMTGCGSAAISPARCPAPSTPTPRRSPSSLRR